MTLGCSFHQVPQFDSTTNNDNMWFLILSRLLLILNNYFFTLTSQLRNHICRLITISFCSLCTKLKGYRLDYYHKNYASNVLVAESEDDLQWLSCKFYVKQKSRILKCPHKEQSLPVRCKVEVIEQVMRFKYQGIPRYLGISISSNIK